ncbi:tetratricopeptide repeat protein [Kitasatospora sp. NPDC088134]|uniref:tetratricopeptide repeat protein n=1 Tax=Kitasatospora sp. NPDC088134 TaxID=3364071 RepID=UPI00382349B0
MADRERELAELRARVAVARARGAAGLPELVEALHRWAGALLGDPVRAVEEEAALAECVDAARTLARERPEYRPGLAAALYRQSLSTGVRGERARALPVARESVDLYRKLADEDGPLFGPPLAAALENLANQLAGTGARAAAVAAVREAVALRRAATHWQPGTESAAELASALADLGIALGEDGQHAEAVDAAREAVAGYRALGGGSDPHLVAYWAALLSLAQELAHTGQHRERDGLLPEIAATRRHAAHRHPELTAHLDATLHRAGYRIGPDGLIVPAVPADRPGPPPADGAPMDGAPVDGVVEEALRRIAEGAARGHASARRGAYGAAVGEFRAAVELARGLPGGGARERAALAAVLHDLGLVLGWAERPGEAIGVLEESAAIRRALVAADGGRTAPLLAECLDTLGTRLAALGRHREALAATREAVELQRAAADRSGAPEQLRDLARTTNNLSIRWADAGRHRKALEASRLAVASYRAAPSEAEEHLVGLVHALTNLALREARLRRTAPVPALVREAVELLDRPVRFPPGGQRRQLAQSFTWLAWYLRRHGEPEAAALAERAAGGSAR